MRKVLFAVALTLAVSIKVLSKEVFDDDLSQTNSEAEGYTTTKCAKYLCSAYSKEAKKYLDAGCQGDFDSYLPMTSTNGEVTIVAGLIIAGCSFLGSFIFGAFLGKHYKA